VPPAACSIVAMPKTEPLERLRKICRSLPDTKETLKWGKPHFVVAEKIFTGFDPNDGEPSIGFKLEMDHAAVVVQSPGFERAPYVGHKGWVTAYPERVKDWDVLEEMVRESYRLIAPKKSLAKLEAGAAAAPAAKARAAKAAKVAKKTPRAKAAKKAAKKAPRRPAR
jgi:predicted DNA-binding protein (MmcQ/YjbR family)